MEIADVFVVNKADREGTGETVRDLELMLDLSGHPTWRPPIVETVATSGKGIEELFDAIAAHRHHLESTGELERRRFDRLRDELETIVLQRLRERARAACEGSAFDQLVRRVAAREIDPYVAAVRLLDPGA
jgi:LAO/AO transport system kinase